MISLAFGAACFLGAAAITVMLLREYRRPQPGQHCAPPAPPVTAEAQPVPVPPTSLAPMRTGPSPAELTTYDDMPPVQARPFLEYENTWSDE